MCIVRCSLQWLLLSHYLLQCYVANGPLSTHVCSQRRRSKQPHWACSVRPSPAGVVYYHILAASTSGDHHFLVCDKHQRINMLVYFMQNKIKWCQNVWRITIFVLWYQLRACWHHHGSTSMLASTIAKFNVLLYKIFESCLLPHPWQYSDLLLSIHWTLLPLSVPFWRDFLHHSQKVTTNKSKHNFLMQL